MPWLLEEQTLCQHICGPRLQNIDFKCMKISILIGEKGGSKAPALSSPGQVQLKESEIDTSYCVRHAAA